MEVAVEPEEVAIGFMFIWLFVAGAVIGRFVYKELSRDGKQR
jgi:hypothetical protein